MALLSILDRFRPAGAPGPAAVGVPTTGERGPEVELAPVLRMLDVDVARCEQIRVDALADADRVVAAARDEAAAVLARARTDADGDRARAAARVQESADAQDEAVTREAVARAAALAARGRARIPSLVEAVVGDLLDRAPDLPAGPGGRGGAA